MPRITRLRELRGGNVAVDLDGGEWRTLPADAVVRAGLYEGLELDRERLRVLGRERRRSEGIARATRALRYRDLSTERLDERLAKAGIPPAARRETVAALTTTGLLDDERLAAALAVSLADRGFGDDAIRARLEQQVLPAKAIGQALATLEPESERAERIVARRGRSLRTASYLSRRGFSGATVEAALDLLLADGA